MEPLRQFEPHFPNPRRRMPRALTDPTRAQVAIALVVVILLGLLTGYLIHRSHSSSTSSATPPPVQTATANPASEAVSLESLLVQSAKSRTQAGAAVNAIGTCQDLAGARTSLLAAASARDSLNSRLAALQLSALPGSAAMTADLQTAWRASSTADRAYAAWAAEVGSCTGSAPQTQSYTAAQSADAQATASKNAFLNRWDPIAQRYGIAPRTNAQL